MLRARHLLVAMAAICACSKGPSDGGNPPSVTLLTREQHTSRFFPIASGPHALECNACHGTSSTFRDFDCLSCHAHAPLPTNSRHKGMPGYGYDSASCYGCHRDGRAGVDIDHSSFFPVATGQVHALGAPAVHVAGTIGCASCHNNPAERTQIDCTSCHSQTAMAPLHFAVPDLKFTTANETSALCVKCHPDSASPIAVANHAPFKLGDGAVHRQQACLACHAVARSDKPFAQDFRQRACIGCHSEAMDQVVSRHALVGIAAAPSDTESCLSCHREGEAATAFDHVFFPIAATDVHALGAPAVNVPGSFGCRSCHTTGASTKVDCTACHDAADQNARHAGLIGPGGATALWSGTGAAPGGETANCLLCHANAARQRVATHAVSLTQPAGFPIAGGNHFQSCEQCHTAFTTAPALRNPQLDFTAQFAAVKSSCGFLRAGAVVNAVWHCSHDWKWFPPAIGNPAGCVRLTACVITRCSAPLAWQRRQLAVSPPGAAPVPLQSGVPFAGSGPTKPLCLAFWSASPWQTVQSTEVDAPVVWQLLQEIVPGRCTAAAPKAWTSPSATGKKMWLKLVAGSPFGWQLRQLAVSVGTAVIWRRACLETTWSTDSL